MRWIAMLVATCLVALGAMRGHRLEPRDREGRESTIEDASVLVAKLAPRRPSAVAPDKRSERLDAVVPPPPRSVARPSQLALGGVYTAPRTPWVPHLIARTSRGPPRAG